MDASGSGDPDDLVESIEYSRPAPDRIVVRAVTPRAGFVRVIESWDPGWSARIDGQSVPVLRVDSFLMAVAVEPGQHKIEWVYATPGFVTGIAGSLLSLCGLGWLLWWNARRSPSSVSSPAASGASGDPS